MHLCLASDWLYILKMKRIVTVALLVLLAAGSYLGYYEYDHHHLTSDLKRTLQAALDPDTTDADAAAYLRQAHLQVRTKLDAEVEGRFQQAVTLAMSAAARQQRFMTWLQEQGQEDPAESLVRTEVAYRNAGLPVPINIKAAAEKEMADWKDRLAQEKKEQEEDDREHSKEEALTKKLVAQLWIDLDRPEALPGRK